MCKMSVKIVTFRRLKFAEFCRRYRDLGHFREGTPAGPEPPPGSVPAPIAGVLRGEIKLVILLVG